MSQTSSLEWLIIIKCMRHDKVNGQAGKNMRQCPTGSRWKMQHFWPPCLNLQIADGDSVLHMSVHDRCSRRSVMRAYQHAWTWRSSSNLRKCHQIESVSHQLWTRPFTSESSSAGIDTITSMREKHGAKLRGELLIENFDFLRRDLQYLAESALHTIGKDHTS